MSFFLYLCIGLGLVAFAGHLVAWAKSPEQERQHLVRALLLIVWGAASIWLLFVYILAHYCEHNCGDRLNPLAIFVVIGIVAVHLGALWISFRGIAMMTPAPVSHTLIVPDPILHSGRTSEGVARAEAEGAMLSLGIAFHDEKYHFREYRYDHLRDAIAYATLVKEGRAT